HDGVVAHDALVGLDDVASALDQDGADEATFAGSDGAGAQTEAIVGVGHGLGSYTGWRRRRAWAATILTSSMGVVGLARSSRSSSSPGMALRSVTTRRVLARRCSGEGRA